MAACDFCNGSHYLNDSPAFGPCVCCTPENMQKRDRTIALLTEEQTRETASLKARVAELEATQRQTEKADDQKSAVELLDMAEAAISRARDLVAQHEREAVEARRTGDERFQVARRKRLEWRQEAASLLADYFVSLGLPAVPVTLDNPKLADLYAHIEPVADVEPEE